MLAYFTAWPVILHEHNVDTGRTMLFANSVRLPRQLSDLGATGSTLRLLAERCRNNDMALDGYF